MSSATERRSYTYTCLYCGIEYHPKSTERNKYCSRECCFAAKRARKSAILEAERIIREANRRRTCNVCGKQYEAKAGCYCSDECRKSVARRKAVDYDRRKHPGRDIKCKQCGKEYHTEYGEKRRLFCSDKCQGHYEERLHPERKADSNARRRARLKGAMVTRVYRLKVFSRDDWMCQICSKAVSPKQKYPHPMSASLDHIIPLALGGTHQPINCRLAHLICNSLRREKSEAQLLLIP